VAVKKLEINYKTQIKPGPIHKLKTIQTDMNSA